MTAPRAAPISKPLEASATDSWSRDLSALRARLAFVCSRAGHFAADFLLFRSFFSRFWWAFFVLSLGTAFIYVYVVAHIWVDVVDQRTQRIHRNLAKTLAFDLEPLLQPRLREEALRERLRATEALSPVFDLYLYSLPDRRLFSSRGVQEVEGKTIPVSVLREFVDGSLLEPPLRINSGILDGSGEERWRVFSAAPVQLAGNPGYLIAVLGGRRLTEAGALVRNGSLITIGSNLLSGLLVGTSVLGILVLLLVSRRLNAMTAVVRSFQKGDYSRRIGDRSPDELGIFARAFDEMAERMGTILNELKRQDELRRQLVAEVSHELRRPLSTLQLSLDTLRSEGRSTGLSTQVRYVDQALEDSDRLAKLITDLFQLSRLDASQALPDLELCRLDEIADDVVHSFEKLARQRRVQLSFAAGTELPPVRAAVDLIERALGNLIENAIRHTPPGGSIFVTAGAADGAIALEVNDTGCGIAAEDLPHIFERFYRGAGAGRRREGAGLGLCLVKRIVELHKGKISVKSELGKGTAFRLLLPHA